MLYSYFFNAQKTHRLEFALKVKSYMQDTAANQTIMLLDASVTEIMDDVEVAKQTKLGTFHFDPANRDIDVNRIRIAEQNKWIFDIKNNKKADESIIVGLITTSTNKNPLGVDIVQINDGYDAELRGNNLAIIENTYMPPVLDQVLVESFFTTAEWPRGFYSKTSVYDSTFMFYHLKDFKQQLATPIDKHDAFIFNMNIAPSSTTTEGTDIFKLMIDHVGSFILQKAALRFIPYGNSVADSFAVSLDHAAMPTDFFTTGALTGNSKLKIQGDGRGNITFTYAGKVLSASYNPTDNISFLYFETEPKEAVPASTLTDPAPATAPESTTPPDPTTVNWAQRDPAILDNISVVYYR